MEEIQMSSAIFGVETGEDLHIVATTANSLEEINQFLQHPQCLEKTHQMLVAKAHLMPEHELRGAVTKPDNFHPSIVMVARKKLNNP